MPSEIILQIMLEKFFLKTFTFKPSNPISSISLFFIFLKTSSGYNLNFPLFLENFNRSFFLKNFLYFDLVLICAPSVSKQIGTREYFLINLIVFESLFMLMCDKFILNKYLRFF